MTKPNWEYHPICLLFPLMTTEERDELKKDMIDRVSKGLDPLERPILLLDDKIFDGRHRFEVWYEGADENACNGFFARNFPPTAQFSSEKYGTLATWMRAKSLNMVQRNIPADQNAGIFLEAADQFPEVKAAIDAIKEENTARQKAGTPLDASDQRGTTAEQVGKLAGVGATTVKTMQRLKITAPEKFQEVVKGKTTAKKALKEVKTKTPPQPKKQAAAEKPKEIKAGDTAFQVALPDEWLAVPSVGERKIKAVTAKNFLCSDGRRIKKGEQVFSNLDDAKKAWRAVVEAQIGKLKDAVKSGPAVKI